MWLARGGPEKKKVVWYDIIQHRPRITRKRLRKAPLVSSPQDWENSSPGIFSILKNFTFFFSLIKSGFTA
jgi:hypothetical protein